MSDHSHSQVDLTRNQTLVLDALSAADGPLSAYTILDQLREKGFRAPLQVYRALDRLVELSMVHRLESINAFVACRSKGCEAHQMIAFTICEQCNHVSELSNKDLSGLLTDLAEKAAFDLRKTAIELRGICRKCQ